MIAALVVVGGLASLLVWAMCVAAKHGDKQMRDGDQTVNRLVED